jgi:hypothetical protein
MCRSTEPVLDLSRETQILQAELEEGHGDTGNLGLGRSLRSGRTW